MSEFNNKLDLAKSKQRRVYLIAGITGLVLLLLITALFVVSRGTRVEVMTEEAKELATVKTSEGWAFSVGNTVYSLLGNPVVTVSAPGFKTATSVIGPHHLGKVFPLELQELPGRLMMKISGDQEYLEKTIWHLNGNAAALSPVLDVELQAGSYTVTINNPFFQPKEMGVEIKRHEQLNLQVDLQPLDGKLSISSEPAGATVFLDEQEIGATPLELEQPGGRYNLLVKAENYVDTVELLEITHSNTEVNRNYLLVRKKAEVALDLRPMGGTLLVNGIQTDNREMTGPLLLDATIEHRLTYMKPGYYSKSKTVLLAADEKKRVALHLEPEMGNVAITSSPPASIWIDGKDYGHSPLTISLPAVSHTILMKRPGYRMVSKVVQPQGGRTQKISVTLLTEYQARLKEAPREVTNQAGIRMKLYVVQDSFTMGAPRSEKGQRANEFQRRPRLTKPFYASLFEITNGQFAGFNRQRAGTVENNPVTSISWHEAAAFCNWLSKKENINPFYITQHGKVSGFNPHSDGYRLLSEAEWEWLSRKSGKKQQTIFTWGNGMIIPPQAANVADESAKGQVRFYVPNYRDGFPGVANVGSVNREPSGLYDMAGNVSEWVHDVYSSIPPTSDTPLSNPLGPQQGHAHVVKGANFRSGTLSTLRPSFREGLTAGRDDVGFRIARYLYGESNE